MQQAEGPVALDIGQELPTGVHWEQQHAHGRQGLAPASPQAGAQGGEEGLHGNGGPAQGVGGRQEGIHARLTSVLQQEGKGQAIGQALQGRACGTGARCCCCSHSCCPCLHLWLHAKQLPAQVILCVLAGVQEGSAGGPAGVQLKASAKGQLEARQLHCF